MKTDWKVGDEVVVTGRYVRTGRTKISKVGRKYFYLENDPRETPYEISSGHAKHDGYNSNSQCRTPEQYDADTVREEVMQKLRDHGVGWSVSYDNKKTFCEGNFSTARLFELLHLLDQIAEENATTNLDR